MYTHQQLRMNMHKAHPVTLWVEEHLRRMHLNRRRQIAYQQLLVGLLAYPCADAPFLALAMQAALRDVASLRDACK